MPAVNSPVKADPLFVLAGGPSDAATQFFAWLPGMYSGVHATRDIVLIDQRGTGESNAVTLPAMPDVSSLTSADADTALRSWAADSLAAVQTNPLLYTSTVAADDLDAVRELLGYDQIDLYGTSYGGTLSQYYIRQHGEHVRAAILDGSTPIDVPVLELMAETSQGALSRLLRRCAEDADCHAAFPDIATEWSTLVAAFAQGVTVTDPQTGEQVTADLTTVGPSVHQALMTEAGAVNLPLAIHLASQGAFDRTNELVPPINGSPSDGPQLLMRDAILCSEPWATWDPAQVQLHDPSSYAVPFVSAWALSRADRCRYLQIGRDTDSGPLVTNLPILWLTGDGDPQDPPANLTSIPAQQPNSLIAVMPAQEHVVGHLGCGPSVIATFLDSGTASGLDISCLSGSADARLVFTLK